MVGMLNDIILNNLHITTGKSSWRLPAAGREKLYSDISSLLANFSVLRTVYRWKGHHVSLPARRWASLND